MHRFYFVSVLILLFVMNVYCDSTTIRQTQNGPVEGIEKISSLKQKYYAFRGVPFAEPPITGRDPYTDEQVDRRFKAPEPLKRHWIEPLKVHNNTNSCMQSTILKAQLSEDCLYLNIYVPGDGVERKTVLVYIFGGGFNHGSAIDAYYGPDFLLSQDNIVVTIQYRLGIFGFLHLNYTEYTGNMGLKDQQLALKWIYENIENFSGNKDQITIFGESAGGASVQLHMINEESQKYFQRAFSMSGSGLQSYVLWTFDREQQIQNCTQTNDTIEIVEFLKTANSSTILGCNKPGWFPTIEDANIKDAFLTQFPDKIYNTSKTPIMDAMFSFASKEAIQLRPNVTDDPEPLIKEDWRETNIKLPFDGFTKAAHPKEYAQAVGKLRAAYYPDTTNVDAIINGNIGLLSDSALRDAVLKSIVLQAISNNRGTNNRNTFLFRFSVNANLNIYKILSKKEYTGATHTDDLCYMFHCHFLDQFHIYDKILESKGINYDIIMRSVKMLTNFARTGDPSVEGDVPFKSSNSENEIYCQEISNQPFSHVTYDIKDHLHYNTWREIEEIYHGLKDSSTERISKKIADFVHDVSNEIF